MDRENLEREALEACSPDLFYELQDDIEITTDEELLAIIKGLGE